MAADSQFAVQNKKPQIFRLDAFHLLEVPQQDSNHFMDDLRKLANLTI